MQNRTIIALTGGIGMTQTQTAPEPISVEDAQGGDGKRERSTINFPYQDLDSSIEIARAVHTLTGSQSELEQIAAQLNMSPKSSGLYIQISSAKVFGLVTGSQGVITLTLLGNQICDQQQEKAARVAAFLAVPLYKALYEKFRGGVLPPDQGLETAIVGLGVAQKQKERARQIFRRSAQQAGFFQFGTDRLVLPAIKAAATVPLPAGGIEDLPLDETPPDKIQRRTRDSGGGDELHPFIQGLLRELPPAKTEWPIEKRAKWLQTAANMFDMIYLENDDDNKRSINIDLKKDSAK